MAERSDRARPDRCPCALHQRARDHRKRADDRGLVLQPASARSPRDRRAKSVDDRQAARDSEQIRQPGEGAFAGRAEGGAHIGFADRLAGAAAPEPGGHALETGLAREVADPLAGDDQFAALAIDMAEHGFGGGNAVQADRGLGKLHVHGRNLLCNLKGRALSTD
jgi:hypothetical protein